MEQFVQELKNIYSTNKVVEDNNLDLVVDTINIYCNGLSKLTGIDVSYFQNIIKKIDFIRFSIDNELKKLEVENDCKTYNFNKNNKTGIIVKEVDECRMVDGLTHEMTHFFIKFYVDSNLLSERNLNLDEKSSRLYEGICEFINQETWHKINPEKETIGEMEDKYWIEVQVASFLMDSMNKNLFLKNIFTDPNCIFDKIKNIKYQNTNLLNYIDTQLKPLIPLKGVYNKDEVGDVDILDSFEAICDCGKMLKLGGNHNEVNSQRK